MMRRLSLGAIVFLCILTSDLRAQVKGAKKPSFDSGGVQIHYTVQGKEDGEPVLLIHGFTANIDMQWAPVIKALSKDYKVIAFDCRGHGGSEKPHDPAKYGLEMARDAIRLLDHLKIDKAHVVGYSMGGIITLQIAARFPERVKTATLGGAGLVTQERMQLLEVLADSLEQGKGIAPLIVALTPKNQRQPTEEEIKTVNTFLMALNDSKALAALIRAATGKEMFLSDEQVKAIKMPMLALIGSDDPFLADVEQLKKRLPDLPVVQIDKADHITAFTREEFIQAIKKFLDAHGTGKR